MVESTVLVLDNYLNDSREMDHHGPFPYDRIELNESSIRMF